MRGFFDWMVAELFHRGLFEGTIVVTTPRPARPATLALWRRSDHQFTVSRRGFLNGNTIDQRDLVTVVSRIIDPHAAFDDFLATAANPDLVVVVSNTTEAGLAYQDEPWNRALSPQTVAGRLTRWFFHRWSTLGEGAPPVDVLPFELVPKNAAVLQGLMARYTADWGLPASFATWLFTHNAFYNTLVDSITTSAGPNTLDVIREPYYRLVLDGFGSIMDRLPFDRAGLTVDLTADVTPYQTLKIRALNGTHTTLAGLGSMAGLATVGEVMRHPLLSTYVLQLLNEEIAPTLPRHGLSPEDIRTFISAVIERFENPFLSHYLKDIEQNVQAKLVERLLPTIEDYWTLYQRVPPLLCLGFAAAAASAGLDVNLNSSSLPEVSAAIRQSGAELDSRGWEAALRTRLI